MTNPTMTSIQSDALTVSTAIRQAAIERAKIAPLETWADPTNDLALDDGAKMALFQAACRALGRQPRRYEAQAIIDSYQSLFIEFIDIAWSAACYVLDGDEAARAEMRPVECPEADWSVVVEQALKAAQTAKERASLLPEHQDEDDGEPTPAEARARIEAAALADYAEMALGEAEAVMLCDCPNCTEFRQRKVARA